MPAVSGDSLSSKHDGLTMAMQNASVSEVFRKMFPLTSTCPILPGSAGRCQPRTSRCPPFTCLANVFMRNGSQQLNPILSGHHEGRGRRQTRNTKALSTGREGLPRFAAAAAAAAAPQTDHVTEELQPTRYLLPPCPFRSFPPKAASLGRSRR